MQATSREVDVNGQALTVYEHTELENEAGAVVWDAALVLLHYFATGEFLKGMASPFSFSPVATVH